jgi:D-alanyl-lipoteichoic acid acyltransferase DltB (MBOAT superfamily)
VGLHAVGVQAHKPVLDIILPLGISFHTFQTLSHSIDVHRGRLVPSRSWVDYAAFILFFPQLVAGPIERASHMLPQYQRKRVIRAEDVQEGLWLILLGYFRKVAIADTAAVLCEPMFSHPEKFDSSELVAGLLLFTVQIYGDFAGYSDIARGTARLFGFELKRNFEHPYFAINVSDFWRRWHISLSTWLRDYLYVPLGGNRNGTLLTYRNLMITMLLGGLWHGASWNFVIWGALHGAYLCIHRALKPVIDRAPTAGLLGALFTASGALLTFALVAFTWLFFRSATFELTQAYLAGFVRDGEWLPRTFIPLFVLAAMALTIDIPQHLTKTETPFVRLPRVVRLPLAAAMITALCLSQDSGQPFIYFQF